MSGSEQGRVVVSVCLAACLFASVSATAQTVRRGGRSRAAELEARIEALESRVKAIESQLEHGATGRTTARRASADGKSPVLVRLIEKSFQEGDVLSDRGDRIAVTLELESALKKPARAFSGVVIFKDVFDREILRVRLTDSSGLAPHQRGRWRGWFAYQQFDEGHRRLKNIAMKDLGVEFVVEQVVYRNGSRETLSAPDDSVQTKLIAMSPPASAPAAPAPSAEPPAARPEETTAPAPVQQEKELAR